MTAASDSLSLADWGRFGSGETPRCLVCGHHADVRVELQALDLTRQDKGLRAKHVARESVYFCHTHGILRYGYALRKLQGV